MKKLVSLTLIIFLLYSLTACNYNEVDDMEKFELPEKSELQVRKNVKPLQSYGNQVNQQLQSDYLLKAGDWFYGVKGHRMFRFHADDPETVMLIQDFENVQCYPIHISQLGDWLYFMLEEISEDGSDLVNLYRIKKDGSEMTKLAGEVRNYILTENEVYYESDQDGEADGGGEVTEAGIYVMSLDGHQGRRLPGRAQSLMGIDNGWIYYVKNGEDHSIYRMKPDGSKKEKVLAVDENNNSTVDYWIVENEQIYFVKNDNKNDDKYYLMKKTINGSEMVLDSNVELEHISVLNKEGDWLYYDVGKKINKININGKGKKTLVYQFSSEGSDALPININSILLYDRDILVSAFDQKLLINKDGLLINLGQILENWYDYPI